MKKIPLYIFTLFCMAMFFSSCADEETCLDNSTSLVKVQFLDSAGVSKNIILTRLAAIGNQDGFPQYDNDTASYFLIAMNPELDYTTLIFEQPENKKDTIALTYKVTPTFISSDCGIDFYFANLDTASTTFEQLEITNMIFNKDIDINVEIIH